MEFERIDFEAFASRWSDPPKTPADPPPPSFPEVPTDEFPVFRAACRDRLPGERFRMVDRELLQAEADTSDWLEDLKGSKVVRAAAFRQFLASLIRPCRSVHQMLTRARGAQVAAFRHGVLVKVDLDALAGGYFSGPLAVLDRESATALRSYADTRYAAVGVAALVSRRGLAALASMNINDVDALGRWLTAAGERFAVPETARGILRAHRIFRERQGAAGSAPLFVAEDRTPSGRRRSGFRRISPHGVRQQLRQIALETGLSVAGKDGWVEGQDRRWLSRRGLTVHPL